MSPSALWSKPRDEGLDKPFCTPQLHEESSLCAKMHKVVILRVIILLTQKQFEYYYYFYQFLTNF